MNNDTGVVGASTEVTLHAVKVLDCNGCGSTTDVAAGITFTADQGWDVGSLSLGGDKSSAIEDAVEYAYGNGVLLVAAAGNEGPCTNCVDYPAAEPEVIAVSATNKDDQLAAFSNQGPDIELAAPGTDIYSTVIGGYTTFSGTSMACPHVSGTAGLVMAKGYGNAEARTRLNSTAEDIGLGSNEQGNGLVDAEAAVAVGETGTVFADQPTVATWQTVELLGTYENPVVIMHPPSMNGGQPAHIRLRNVGSEQFEFKIEEWEYIDGAHLAETIHYLVMDAGVHTLADGTTVQAGTNSVDHTWTSVGFPQGFDSAPVVFSQSQTVNGGYPIITRQKAVTTDGYAVRVQEEEAGDGVHFPETVGFIAIEQGTHDLFEAQKTADNVTHAWTGLNFDRSYDSTPLFIAQQQTANGGQPGALRYRNLNGSSVEVMVQEEQSADDELLHLAEAVGYVVMTEAGRF